MAIFTRNGVHDVRGPALESPFYREHGFTAAPVVVQCYLTLRCALSCAHCLAARAGVASADMPSGLFEKLCREAAELGVEEMLLTGGEPLMREDLGGIVACLRDHGLAWTLNTATCPTAAQQAAIRRHPPGFVAVSLDGPAAVHNAFRGSTRAFENAMASLRFFSDLGGTTVCAGTTVTTQNLPHFEKTFAIVRESGAHRWGIHLLIPEGRARTRKDLFPTTRQMRSLLKSVARKRAEFPVSLCDEMGFAGEWESLVRDEAFYCAAGRAMCAVLPDGSVMPCSTLDPRHCEGDLARNTLAEIWRTGFAAQRAPRREGKCASCQDWAACGSGCWLQRTHGTQCFKHLWKAPESLKAAAGIALCIGSLHGGAARAGSAVELRANPADASTGTFRNANAGVSPDTADDGHPLILRGLFAGKSAAGRGISVPTENAVRSSVHWLREQQRADGTWGEPKQRVMLTALATLAFLSHGETHTSEPNGAAINRAFAVLMSWASNPRPGYESNVRQDAVLAWCLAEAYTLARDPRLRTAALEQSARLLDDKATPWHVLAWEVVSRPDIDETAGKRHLAKLADAMPAATNDILRQSTACLLSIRTRGWEQSQEMFATLQAQKPERWTSSDEPLLCALMVNRVVAEAARTVRLQWNHTFLPAVLGRFTFIPPTLKAQTAGDFPGWWDAGQLGVSKTAETEGFSEEDARIFTTAMMILSLHATQKPSPERPPSEARSALTNAPGDVIIDLK